MLKILDPPTREGGIPAVDRSTSGRVTQFLKYQFFPDLSTE